MAKLKIKDRLGSLLRGGTGASDNTVITKSVRPSGITLSVVKGRIEKEDVDVVVNSLSVSMNLEHGLLAVALSRKAGSSLQAAIDEFSGPAKYGDVFKTAGFRLRARSVYHVVLCGFNYPNAGDVLEGLVLRCLELADKDQRTSISIPALGTGRHSFPPFVVAHRLVEAVRRYEGQAGKNPSVKTVRFVLLEPHCIGTFQTTLSEIPSSSQRALVEKMKTYRHSTGGNRTVMRPSEYLAEDLNTVTEAEAATDIPIVLAPPQVPKAKRPNKLQIKIVKALGVNKTFKKEQLINQLRTVYRELPLPRSFVPWPYVVTSMGPTLRSRDIEALVEAAVGAEVHRKRNLVLVHGPTYVGKSSLVNRIARLWADGGLKHIRLVIVVNLPVLLYGCSSKTPSLRECLLHCFELANIDHVGGYRLFEFSSGRILLLIDDAEAWCEHFRDELQIDPLFSKVHVIVTSRTSSSVRLAATFRPKMTIELCGFGTELIQQFLLLKNPGYSLELADTMSYIATNATSLNLIQTPGWLEHCYEVIIRGGLHNASPQEVLQRQIWLVNAYLDMNTDPGWLKQFRDVQLQLGEAFLFYYIKKKDPQWAQFSSLNILNIGPSPRLLIDYCIAAYIIDDLEAHGQLPFDLNSMERVYMLQTSVEMACGQSVRIARCINRLITMLADEDTEVQLAREHALDLDDARSARILKRVNDLQVGCLRQGSTPQQGMADVPEELQYLGAEYARVYLLACEQGTKAVRRTRVMIVGHFGAGKTSLKRRLVNEAFEPAYVVTNGIEADPATCTIHVDDASKNWSIIRKALGVNDEHSSEVARVLYEFIKNLKAIELPVSDEPEVDTPDIDHAPDLDFASIRSFSRLDSDHSNLDDVDGPLFGDKKNLDVDDRRQESPCPSTGSGGPRPMRSISMNALVSAMGAAGMSDAEKVVDSLPEPVICELKKLMIRDPDHPYTRDSHDHSRPRENHTESLNRQTSNEVKFSFWDFAGQHVFYTTHQTFLSHRAIYLLVLDLMRPLHFPIESHRLSRRGMVVDRACPQTVGEYLDYWLNSIHTHAVMRDTQQASLTQPPVIIVCTHKDALEKKHGKNAADRMVSEYFCSINMHLDRKAYHDHISPTFFAVSNSIDNDPCLELLREELVRVAEDQPYWGEQIPLKWLALRGKLRDLQNNSTSVVSRTQVIELAQEVGISCSTEVVTFLLFYHALGELVFFDEDSLCDLVILDPQWLIENFREVITVRQFHKQQMFANSRKHWANLDDYGVLNDVILQKVWDPRNKDQLVSIMQKFNLILPISSDYQPDDQFEVPGWQGPETQLYLVPCMLPQAAPEDIIRPGKSDPCPLLLAFKEGFVPLGVFHRLLATCINQMHWECFGAVYHDFASFLPWPGEMDDVMISLQVQAAHIQVTACSLCDEQGMSAKFRELLPQALRTLTEQLQQAMRTVSPTQSFFVAVQCTCRGEGQPGTIVNLDKIRTPLANRDMIRCLAHKVTFNAKSIQPWFAKPPDPTIIPKIAVIVSQPAPSEDEVPSEQQLLDLAEDLGGEWEELAIHLGLTTANIEQCKMDSHRTVMRITNMLIKWRNQKRELRLTRRIDHLTNALLATRRADLAEKVATWKVVGVDLDLDEAGPGTENGTRTLPQGRAGSHCDVVW